MKIPTEHLFEKTNICSPRYTYTLFTEKLSQNLLLKNSLKAKRYTYTDFPKSFPKVGENREKCVHRRTNLRFIEQPFTERTNFHLYEQNFTHEQVFGKSNKNSNTNSSLQTRTKFYNKLECEKANKLFNENTLT